MDFGPPSLRMVVERSQIYREIVASPSLFLGTTVAQRLRWRKENEGTWNEFEHGKDKALGITGCRHALEKKKLWNGSQHESESFCWHSSPNLLPQPPLPRTSSGGATSSFVWDRSWPWWFTRGRTPVDIFKRPHIGYKELSQEKPLSQSPLRTRLRMVVST